jgi:hypothetical protein
VAGRWPTALGLLAGLDTLLGEVTDATTRGFAEAMLLLPTIYVVMAVVGRRRWTWPIVIASLAGFVALRMQDQVEPSVVVLAIALGAAVWGVGHGRHRETDFRLQLAGLAGFGALALAGLAVDADLARYLVAAGWFGHAVWDVVHLVRDRVVARSFAEWCAAVDLTIAVALVAVPLL